MVLGWHEDFEGADDVKVSFEQAVASELLEVESEIQKKDEIDLEDSARKDYAVEVAEYVEKLGFEVVNGSSEGSGLEKNLASIVQSADL